MKMSKMKIGKYLCISWMVLTTALIVFQDQRINNLESSLASVEVVK